MRKKSRQNLAGFTLLEVLVAISIFAVVLTGVSGIFANFVKNYHATKQIQRNLENAQFAINSMAKVLRTSKLLSSDGNTAVSAYDYSQDKCLKFEFADNNLKKYTANPGTAGDPATCPVIGAFVNPDEMIYRDGAVVTTGGKFLFPIPSDKSSADWKVGMVTVDLDISSGTDVAHMQTTVSLRDYVNAF